MTAYKTSSHYPSNKTVNLLPELTEAVAEYLYVMGFRPSGKEIALPGSPLKTDFSIKQLQISLPYSFACERNEEFAWPMLTATVGPAIYLSEWAGKELTKGDWVDLACAVASCFALAASKNRTVGGLEVPRGLNFAARHSFRGVEVRTILDYLLGADQMVLRFDLLLLDS